MENLGNKRKPKEIQKLQKVRKMIKEGNITKKASQMTVDPNNTLKPGVFRKYWIPDPDLFGQKQLPDKEGYTLSTILFIHQKYHNIQKNIKRSLESTSRIKPKSLKGSCNNFGKLICC